MLGAIIGDIAAWTYENDSGMYENYLSSEKAVLSSLGQAALDTAIWSLDRKNDDYIRYGIEASHNLLQYADRLIKCATLAWSNDNPLSLFCGERDYFYDDKAGMYAVRTIIELIQKLHNGTTKRKALDDGMGAIFKQMKSGEQWKSQVPHEDLYIYLMRAWDCFERSWDFTSAIFNAVTWKDVDKKLLCCLTGALAEAMYGCDYLLFKKKYSKTYFYDFKYPASIIDSVHRIQEYQYQTRVFFPKNSALTNVEKHIWSPYESCFEGFEISTEHKRQLLRAFKTGWDNRYGLYLDDGWLYTYRSGIVIARFRLVQKRNGFMMVDLQRSEEKPDCADCSISEATSSLGYYE